MALCGSCPFWRSPFRSLLLEKWAALWYPAAGSTSSIFSSSLTQTMWWRELRPSMFAATEDSSENRITPRSKSPSPRWRRVFAQKSIRFFLRKSVRARCSCGAALVSPTWRVARGAVAFEHDISSARGAEFSLIRGFSARIEGNSSSPASVLRLGFLPRPSFAAFARPFLTPSSAVRAAFSPYSRPYYARNATAAGRPNFSPSRSNLSASASHATNK